MLSATISSDAIVLADEVDSRDLEPSDEIRECAWEKNLLAEYPHSHYAMCELQRCEEPPSTVKERTRAQITEQKVILENDYIVKQFLRKHSDATLEGSALDIVNTLTPITWKITAPHNLESVKAPNAAKLYVNFDNCSYITGYFYDVTHREGDGINAKYSYGHIDPEQLATFEEKKYQLAETIVGRHLPPRIQISELDMQPDKIRCNDGLERVFKHDGSPACVKEQSIPKMIERGWAKIPDAGKKHVAPEQQHMASVVIIPKGAVIEGNENLIPKVITVVLGKNNTVTWINQDDTAHGFASDKGGKDAWGSRGVLKPGNSFSVTFNNTGIYDYHGQPHPWQTGTVIVLEE